VPAIRADDHRLFSETEESIFSITEFENLDKVDKLMSVYSR
jgi:hypothetical protein